MNCENKMLLYVQEVLSIVIWENAYKIGQDFLDIQYNFWIMKIIVSLNTLYEYRIKRRWGPYHRLCVYYMSKKC